jgi:hypothetical protein
VDDGEHRLATGRDGKLVPTAICLLSVLSDKEPFLIAGTVIQVILEKCRSGPW